MILGGKSSKPQRLQVYTATQNRQTQLTFLGRVVTGQENFQSLHVVQFTENVSFFERKLLTSGKLPLARVARETREMVHAGPRASHPVVRMDTSSTSRTFSTELPVEG